MRIYFEHLYHKNYKKYSKNSRWQKFVFRKEYKNTGLSSFAFVIKSLVQGRKLPKYFKNHDLSGTPLKLRRRVAKKIGISPRNINISELHFNGPSSDMLLAYTKYADIIDVLGIGTHKDLKKLM